MHACRSTLEDPTARNDGYVYLSDYAPPPWRIEYAELAFDLDPGGTRVEARLRLQPASAGESTIELDAQDLELLEVSVDGAVLPADRYHHDGQRLRITGLPGACLLGTQVRLRPAGNLRLEGLYASGELLLTQCEAEGFRRITPFLDRPDVMPTWAITLRADRARYPVLLANGNPVASRGLDGGRHEACWRNPHPTPAYLFAIAAGRLERVSTSLTTAEGRPVELNVWADPGDVDRCHYALGAVERALRWDEQRFGRCYDLDVFNVVAAQEFTMGAMENKGLNIFNARYILADEATASDADFLGVESVIAHEYLHNWSGNRVTLRDWFQLSLKEGLTVFRDSEFSADLHSRPLRRIEAVRLLRARQFAEDGGALAHAVRPERYREISNFYTFTIYEKGAEVVRLLHTLLGEATFRAGMDRYFADNDGRAATLEDFLAAHAAASGRDLSQFARWYGQAGTPELHVEDAFDPASGDYTLDVVQVTPPTPEQADKQPLLLPLRLALYGDDGAPVQVAPETDCAVRTEAGTWLVELTQARHRLRFAGLAAPPLPSFNQGFAAPMHVRYAYTPAQLAALARCERDPFARWDVLQRLAGDGLLGRIDADLSAEALAAALADLLDDDGADPAFVAECLGLPDFDTLAEQAEPLDVDALLLKREALVLRLASALRPRLEYRYRSLVTTAGAGLSGPAMAARALRNACLSWLSRIDPAAALAEAQYHAARVLTDRLAALRALVHLDAPGSEPALADFRARAGDDPLMADKWLALVATRPHPDSLDSVRALLDSPWWKPANPNRVRAVLGAFCRSNPTGFHRADGAGYRLLAEQVVVLDAINPQVAARLLGALENWRRLDPGRRDFARAALSGLPARVVSPDCRDLLARLLA